jgi:hypothetical protein
VVRWATKARSGWSLARVVTACTAIRAAARTTARRGAIATSTRAVTRAKNGASGTKKRKKGMKSPPIPTT